MNVQIVRIPDINIKTQKPAIIITTFAFRLKLRTQELYFIILTADLSRVAVIILAFTITRKVCMTTTRLGLKNGNNTQVQFMMNDSLE